MTSGAVKKFRMASAPQAAYPNCRYCGAPLRRPCSIVAPKGKFVICGGCFRKLMIMRRMAEDGIFDTIDFSEDYATIAATEWKV